MFYAVSAIFQLDNGGKIQIYLYTYVHASIFIILYIVTLQDIDIHLCKIGWFCKKLVATASSSKMKTRKIDTGAKTFFMIHFIFTTGMHS